MDNQIVNRVFEFLKKQYQFDKEQMSLETTADPEFQTYFTDIVVKEMSKKAKATILIVQIAKGLPKSAESRLFRLMTSKEAAYGIFTDGINYLFYGRDDRGGIIEIPQIISLLRQRQSSKKVFLNAMPNFSFKLEKIFWMIADSQRNKQLNANYRTLSLVQKLLLCKIVDEQSESEGLLFYVDIDLFHFQKPYLDSMNLSLEKRIGILFDKVKSQFKDIFPPYDKIDIDSIVLHKVVTELQSFSLSRTNKDVLREGFEQLLRTTFSFDYNITPKPIADFIIGLLEPTQDETIVDPALGIGSFLISSISYMSTRLKGGWKEFKEYAEKNLFGIEANLEILTSAKINMVLQGDGHANLIAEPIFPMSHTIPNKKFDIVIMNPPYGQTLVDKELHDHHYIPVRTFNRIESLYLFKGLNLLKEGGRLAIVVPETFLSSHFSSRVRDYLVSYNLVKSIISLPSGMLQPFSNAKPVVIVLEKPRAFSHPDNKRKSILMGEITDIAEFRNTGFAVADKFNDFCENGNGLQKLKEMKNIRIINVTTNELINNYWDMRYQLWKRNHQNFLDEGVPIREVVEIFRGMPISSSKYSFEQDRKKVPYIRISDMQKGKIVRSKLKYINIDEIRDITRYIIKEGDILFSIKGTIGKVALVDRQFDNSIASSQIAVLRPKKRDLNPNYLYYVLSSSTTKKQADILKHGFIDGLSVMDLENIRIKLLPLEQQQRIVANIETEEERYEEATLFLQKSMSDRITEIMDGIPVHD